MECEYLVEAGGNVELILVSLVKDFQADEIINNPYDNARVVFKVVLTVDNSVQMFQTEVCWQLCKATNVIYS